MDNGTYGIIKLLLTCVESAIKIDLVDGSSRIIPISTEKLLSELEKDQTLEKEANWLAEKLHTICKHEVPNVCAMLDINKCPFFPDGQIYTEDYNLKCKCETLDWREAARKAVRDETNA